MNTGSKTFVMLAFLAACALILLVIGLPSINYAAPPPPSGERLQIDDVPMVYAGRSLSHGLIAQPTGDLMSQDFEGVWPGAGWALSDLSSGDGGEYLFGKRNCHPFKGSNAGWSVGGGAQGNQLACGAAYSNSVSTWAVFGPFDLSTATSASLNFHLWGRSESESACSYDFLYAGSSVDDNNFQGTRYCGDWTGGSEANGYYARQFDLSDRLGQKAVWIAFMFRSDSTTTDIGMTVDDIVLQASTGVSPTPTPPQAANTATPTATATETPRPTATGTVTEAPTPTPTTTSTDAVTLTPTVTSRPGLRVFLPLILKFLPPPATPTATQTATTTQTPTVSPTASRTPTPSVTPTATPTSAFVVPADGDWRGQASQPFGGDVKFSVTNGGSSIPMLTIDVLLGACGYSVDNMRVYNLSVSGGRFTSSDWEDLYVSGTFSSATAASGTWQAMRFNTQTQCYVARSGTWSATKQ
jgi:hypothetical protein